MQPTSNGVLRRGARQHDQRNRSVTNRSVDSWPIDPSNWINVLNALLRENNHRHTAIAKDVSFKTMAERSQFFFRFFRQLREAGYRLDPLSRYEAHSSLGGPLVTTQLVARNNLQLSVISERFGGLDR